MGIEGKVRVADEIIPPLVVQAFISFIGVVQIVLVLISSRVLVVRTIFWL